MKSSLPKFLRLRRPPTKDERRKAAWAEDTKNTVANTIRRIRKREEVNARDRPSGVMVDYDDLEHCFDILDVHLAPDLRNGRPVTIDPNSTVGQNIVHLTRDDQ